jgi:hypothetical protein
LQQSLLGLNSKEHDLCFIKQIHLIAYFYLVNVVVDVMLFLLGDFLLGNGDLKCANSSFILVKNEVGGLFMLFHAATVIAYSLVMLIIFFQLPRKHYMVSYMRRGLTKVTVDRKVTESMAHQEEVLSNFIELDKQREEFETQRCLLSSDHESIGKLPLSMKGSPIQSRNLKFTHD